MYISLADSCSELTIPNSNAWKVSVRVGQPLNVTCNSGFSFGQLETTFTIQCNSTTNGVEWVGSHTCEGELFYKFIYFT